jgi:hypothetical protein
MLLLLERRRGVPIDTPNHLQAVLMNRQAIKKARDRAVSLKLHLDGDDAVRHMLSRESGLFLVARNQIVRVRSPNDLDPELEHPDAPWEQSVYLLHGARDPLVARTILQTEAMAEMFFGKRCDKHRAMMDISWEVLSSLVSLRVVRERLEKRIGEIIEVAEADLDSYTKGHSPKPLPLVEYYDIEFRSFVNEMRRVLSKISEIFAVLTTTKIDGGHFHNALEWARKERGEKSLLAMMLAGDQRWIKLWIDVRIAIEPPTRDTFSRPRSKLATGRYPRARETPMLLCDTHLDRSAFRAWPSSSEGAT